MGSHLTGGIEYFWGQFKDAVNKAQKTLPLVLEKGEKDWVTEGVRDVSRLKLRHG